MTDGAGNNLITGFMTHQSASQTIVSAEGISQTTISTTVINSPRGDDFTCLQPRRVPRPQRNPLIAFLLLLFSPLIMLFNMLFGLFGFGHHDHDEEKGSIGLAASVRRVSVRGRIAVPAEGNPPRSFPAEGQVSPPPTLQQEEHPDDDLIPPEQPATPGTPQAPPVIEIPIRGAIPR